MNKSHIRAWCLYDFANSGFIAVFVVLFNVYYTDHIVGNEAGLGDWWWGCAISLSAAVVALTSPFMGAVADRTGRRKLLLAVYTGINIAATLAFTTLEQGMIVRGFLFAAMANFAFEGAVVFYNAYLPEIAPSGRQGRVSGWGFGIGYVGSVVAILLGMVFVRTESLGIRWAWVQVAAQFLLFSLPALIVLPSGVTGKVGILRAGVEGVSDTWRILNDALTIVNLRRFLGAYFLYVNGVNTVIVFASVFAVSTLAFTQTQTLILFLVVQISACVGAFTMARPTDTLGPKKVVIGSLYLWVLVVVGAAVVQSKPQFFVLAAVAGLGLGTVQAASRSLMTRLIPIGKEAEFFGFYALCGKSSAILGPVVFGAISHQLGQRAGIASVAVFFITGLLLLQRVRADGERDEG